MKRATLPIGVGQPDGRNLLNRNCSHRICSQNRGRINGYQSYQGSSPLKSVGKPRADNHLKRLFRRHFWRFGTSEELLPFEAALPKNAGVFSTRNLFHSESVLFVVYSKPLPQWSLFHSETTSIAIPLLLQTFFPFEASSKFNKPILSAIHWSISGDHCLFWTTANRRHLLRSHLVKEILSDREPSECDSLMISTWASGCYTVYALQLFLFASICVYLLLFASIWTLQSHSQIKWITRDCFEQPLEAVRHLEV